MREVFRGFGLEKLVHYFELLKIIVTLKAILCFVTRLDFLTELRILHLRAVQLFLDLLEGLAFLEIIVVELLLMDHGLPFRN